LTHIEEVTGDWRKLHNKELNNLYSSPNIIKLTKSITRWLKHVARMRREMHTKCYSENLKERDHLGGLGVDGILDKSYGSRM
jgi:hypothetical protein